MFNKIIDILIEILTDNCPHSLKKENNYFNLYSSSFNLYNLYCHYDVNNQEYVLCKSCTEIIDMNCNKSLFFQYMKKNQS